MSEGQTPDWDINDAVVPRVAAFDSSGEWCDGHVRRVCPPACEEARQHASGQPKRSHSEETLPDRAFTTERTKLYDTALAENQECQAIRFEKDALRVMAKKNGVTLLSNNPRMWRVVQTSQIADDFYAQSAAHHIHRQEEARRGAARNHAVWCCPRPRPSTELRPWAHKNALTTLAIIIP
ncbi:hypothetical protein PYW07_011985 [Mythimna separata]|uniref:Uncharacterized protein n=1 Tax=Mythimna separata TaxID=271217 RepID=A0AAD7YMH9_MYTSE|nr:hypothetical protein PYW07_011985 [Mythimna separata]